MSSASPKDVRQRKLASAILERQSTRQPVHTWQLIATEEPDDWKQGYRTVGQFMSTDLFTVQPDDLIDLAASVMDWRHIRHVPVEDGDGRLVGLVTHRSLLRMLANGNRGQNGNPITVREVMLPNPLTVSPATSSLEAMEIMRSSKIGCLPVVEENHLIGIVTSFDFLDASARLFKEQLTDLPPSQPAALWAQHTSSKCHEASVALFHAERE
jgi:CBS domain-containing protein